ncbi:endo-beta-N-acetylglucosaminidase [Streptomyces halobius]|uniref:Endo-beta-N-acetylglucosaminidase n=1 Tax=Streptomyces halobius TaxID=2879846 RepID=A0ABY4MN32_9ACTN|nr:endo-beta-N-acetylglucosaminidase [Streptomyces halobius]UQA98129.1 endo-beta-N-acetylglucosaminidase [Streptomyces halobius]
MALAAGRPGPRPDTTAGRPRTASPLQPCASYWFPDSLPSGTPGPGITWRSLAEWTPEGDRDLPFNTATVPLAKRFTPVPANRTARSGQARISALAAFAHTAGNPSQGSAIADYYAPTHWAYIDELVFWGGSSGEGLVLAPNAPVVDAAHRNGVPVLGTVFLPPVPFGGDLRWTRDLVQKDAAGRFPLAAKLVQVATAYGFDGWFINAETDGGDAALAADMQAFLRALRAAGSRRGLRITWYDALNVSGRVGWQGALNELNQPFFQDDAGPVADSLFVDFRWTARRLADSGELAGQLGRRRYELWAGVDVESAGWDTETDWDAIIPSDRDHVVSYGFYRPEWTLHHLPEGRTPGQFHAADDRFWSGEGLDPTKVVDPARPSGTGSGWRAPAAAVADRSTISSLPFATTFNTGHGLRWYEDGAVTSDTPWNHLGLQDHLPPRRWSIRTKGKRPDIFVDFANAWRGGSSLLVHGALDAPVTVDLFPTRLPTGAATVVDITYRTDSDANAHHTGADITHRPSEADHRPSGADHRPDEADLRASGESHRPSEAGHRADAAPGPVPPEPGPATLESGPVTPEPGPLTVQSGPVAVEVAVALQEPPAPGAPAPYAYLPAGTIEPGGGWRTVSVRLASLGAGTVHTLGVRLTGRGSAPVAWRLGALAVREGTGQPGAPRALTVTDAATADGTTALRLRWQPATGPVRHYELHRRLPDGTRRFLGGTCGTAFYVPGLRREQGERAVLLEVRSVGELFTFSEPAGAQHPWWAPQAPAPW